MRVKQIIVKVKVKLTLLHNTVCLTLARSRRKCTSLRLDKRCTWPRYVLACGRNNLMFVQTCQIYFLAYILFVHRSTIARHRVKPTPLHNTVCITLAGRKCTSLRLDKHCTWPRYVPTRSRNRFTIARHNGLKNNSLHLLWYTDTYDTRDYSSRESTSEKVQVHALLSKQCPVKTFQLLLI